MRNAISPRLAMRTLRNIRPAPTRESARVRGSAAAGGRTSGAASPRHVRPGAIPRPRRRRELDDQDLLAVLHGVAGLHEAGAEDPVDGGDDLLRDAEHVD